MMTTGKPLKVSDKFVQLHSCAAVNITVLTELQFIDEQKRFECSCYFNADGYFY